MNILMSISFQFSLQPQYDLFAFQTNAWIIESVFNFLLLLTEALYIKKENPELKNELKTFEELQLFN